MQNPILKLILIGVLTCFVTPLFAQSFWFNNKNAPTPTAPSSAPPNPIMSPDDFQNAVNNSSQQSQAALKQQATQQLSKEPLPEPATPSANTNNSSDQKALNTSNSLPNTPVASSPVVSPPAPIQAPNTPARAPQQVGESTINPTATSSSTQQSGVYSGFGTGNTQNSGTRTNSSSNSGGWNIKY